jgi:dihydrofolate reductase
MKPLELIAAVAANGVIGRGNQLPWHLPDDLKHFKALTMGGCIIMGRRTYESIGRPLPGRTSIVVSRSLAAPPAPGVLLADSLDAAEALAGGAAGRAFIIGGAQLYAAAMPRVRIMHLTELEGTAEGDTFFPRWDRAAWSVVSSSAHGRDERHGCAFRFVSYQRRSD